MTHVRHQAAASEGEPRANDTLEVPIVALVCGLLGFVPEALHGRVGSAGTLGLLMIAFALSVLIPRVRARLS